MGCIDNQACYYCYTTQGQFKAIMGTDTVFFSAGNKATITDSVSRYLASGYTVDTLEIFESQVTPGKICGVSNYHSSMGEGDTCILAR